MKKRFKRNKVQGTAERPRLVVFRSLNNISAQVINDDAGKTLCSASTLGKEYKKYGGNLVAAKEVGKSIAQKLIATGVKKVVFDRNGFLYHGRVKALADAAREGGLEF
ncbi:50S ribosomal protein L18 [candidate division WOR-1 bacterium RIFOXYB2_FULL_48_7]|uniref:Large ribosomal subunit protein uL18 n=1 Tax=candidate division WOR-1 bacterium RIFOXYB2_FULL_48_7 TaxID=1802583 RepID=A0A1F4TP22_UNCSA|nr:MAG: 50S ribosomal protein L18 [candidate division WOR-1 bacterium RIFOXYB2_FULL_48_7]